MSRIGRKPIVIAKGVAVSVDGGAVAVNGPKGKLQVQIPEGIAVRVEDGTVQVQRSGDAPRERALHGLVRSLIANAVTGVTEGFTKDLEIHGIGYKAQKEGNDVVFSLGFSHPVRYPVPAGIEVSVDAKQTRLAVRGADKQAVGQVAAELRALRPPDVYKGKGVRYTGETVRKKVGKAGAK
jgi:large subunit ribosomal protein L6